jgi:hypothetical protein
MPSVRVIAALLGGAIVIVAAVLVAGTLRAPQPTSSPSFPAAGLKPTAPHFVEQAAAAGVEHAYDGGFEFYVGGGVAIFDCDSDGLPDLFLAGGSGPAGLYRNASEVGGALRFDRVAAAETDLEEVTGAYPLDIDGDGIADLVVLRFGENVLLRGTGDCGFERANEAWSYDGGSGWTTAFSARWDPGRSWPTIAVGNYLASTDPNELACLDNELIRPASTDDAFAASTALSPGWCSLSMLFSDWDRSGHRDLRVSNDRHYYSDASDGEEQLWRIPGDGLPSQFTRADGWKRVRIEGMGIASYDVTGDGLPDYYLTSQADNKLQALATGASQPEFADIALRRGATAHRPYEGDTTMPSTAWHDEFQDVNNDGLIDLFVSKGNVEAMPQFATRDPSNLLLGNADGTFTEAAQEAGIVDFARARGAGLADLNADGLLDLVVVVRRENVRLWRNVGVGTADAPAALGNWISVRLRDQDGNRDAIGSWIEVRVGDRTALREVTVGGGHVGGQLGPFHFGLADAGQAEVRVTWPDAEIGPWQMVQANSAVLIERGADPSSTQ